MKLTADKELAAAIKNLKFCVCGHEPVVHELAKGKCDACPCKKLVLKTKPMTLAQAQKKAKEVFAEFASFAGEGVARAGKCGLLAVRGGGQGPRFCMNHGRSSGCPGGRPWFEIGTINPTLGCFVIQAGGDTWEEAFETYAARRAKEKAEWAAAKPKRKASR